MSNSANSAYLGNFTALCRTAFGQKMFVDTRDVSIAPHLIMDGIWEMWITHCMDQIVKPGMNCLDLGSNFGWYTLLMAKNVGPDGSVIGVDANERMVELSRRILAINGHLATSKIIHSLIGAAEGEEDFHICDQFMGSSSMLGSIRHSVKDVHDTTRTSRVKMTTLDRLANGKKIDFIKIDCEGAEAAIIAGGKDVLRLKPAIFMEFALSFYEKGVAEKMLLTLAEFGYTFHAIEPDSSFKPVNIQHLLQTDGWHELYLKPA